MSTMNTRFTNLGDLQQWMIPALLSDTTIENYMLDTETSALNVECDVITSMALVPFNIVDLLAEVYQAPLVEFAIDNPNRFEDPATILFREENGISFAEGELELHLSPMDVIMYLQGMLPTDNKTYRIWAKPINFDITALNTFYGVHGVIGAPWYHRHIVDLTSYCAGLGTDINELQMEMHAKGITKRAHTAASDCYDQLKILSEVVFRSLDQKMALCSLESEFHAPLYSGSGLRQQSGYLHEAASKARGGKL